VCMFDFRPMAGIRFENKSIFVLIPAESREFI